ncbi:hypothetical protein XBFM1_1460022 [Xenorhabdus bovienii str. feltiae Moldova]|uniref:Uncharacterized protein n=1 Tax=Xenorhabdus bovienii str. feltiae Moldova TaxID=1398200 RepID=A0A077NN95_XENBV|nr:hypothetical protein XBFM1_1460022 [Xenorhabdus bovienii str. feltiae Moldova]
MNGENILEQLQQENKKTKNPHLKHNSINFSHLSLHIVLNVSVIP